MEILLGGAANLDSWERCPFSPGASDGPRQGDHRGEYRREVGRELPGPPEPAGPFARAADAILAYHVFPSRLIEGVLRREPIETGDTVGIQFHLLGPVRLFFAARAVARFDGEEGGLWRRGFTYRTLVGHPELGEETFAVEKVLSSGVVSVVLRAWSRPGTLLTRMGAPLVRRLQRYANHEALRNLEGRARSAVA